MDLSVALLCFPVVFLGELPDKTMFASLVMATRGRPRQVWLGAAAAFTVHVAIATTVGVALFHLVPRRVVDAVVAAVFLVGAAVAWRHGGRQGTGLAHQEAARHGVVLTACLVIFVAEWGDLTQVLTADLAARYHDPLSVGLGALLALWAVAAIAVTGGQALTRVVSMAVIRRVTAVVLVGLAASAAWEAAH